jgi:hypothetical protein
VKFEERKKNGKFYIFVLRNKKDDILGSSSKEKPETKKTKG